MACANCNKKSKPQTLADTRLPFNANDILVIDHQDVRQLQPSDWPEDKHKLLIFYPQTFTPVCASELGALNKWVAAFAELNCVLIAACTDQAQAIKDWYEQEPLLSDLECLTFSSYLLPARLGLVEGGRAKRSSVFVMAGTGEVVKQEHFKKVGRSFNELHRMLYGFTTDSYCAAEWQSPEDGFLQVPSIT
jgi:alkyl hydroperoxide reductase subunit AhpC